MVLAPGTSHSVASSGHHGSHSVVDIRIRIRIRGCQNLTSASASADVKNLTSVASLLILPPCTAASGRWQVAGGRWQVAAWLWGKLLSPLFALSLVADTAPLILPPCHQASGRWQVAGGRWQPGCGASCSRLYLLYLWWQTRLLLYLVMQRTSASASASANIRTKSHIRIRIRIRTHKRCGCGCQELKQKCTFLMNVKHWLLCP